MADEAAAVRADISVLSPPPSPTPSRSELLSSLSTQRLTEIRYIIEVMRGSALWMNVVKITAAEIAVGVNNRRCAELFAIGILLRRILDGPDNADLADAILSGVKAISTAATSTVAARTKLSLAVVPTRTDIGVTTVQAESELTMSSLFMAIASSASRFGPTSNAFDLIYSRIPIIEYDYQVIARTILESTELLYQRLCDPTVETTPITTVLQADVAIKKSILNAIATDIQSAAMKRILTMDGVRNTSNASMMTVINNTTTNNTNNIANSTSTYVT